MSNILRYESEIGKAITEVMEQATDEENLAPLYTVGTDKLTTDITMEDGQVLKDDLGIERIEVQSTIHPKDSDATYRIDQVDIYAGAKILNNENFDKIELPDKGVITANIHIIDGEFIATVDSSVLFNHNVSIADTADPDKFKNLTTMRGNINLKDFNEQTLVEKLDNLIAKGIKINVGSELGFDMDDLETGKLQIIADRIQEIIRGHIVYNISFDNDYSREEFTDRIKGVSRDLHENLPDNKSDGVKSRINICGNLLKDKEYFTVQGVLVNASCGREIQDLFSVFDSVTLTDKHNRTVDIRTKRF